MDDFITPDNLAGQFDYLLDHQSEWLVHFGLRVDDNTLVIQLETFEVFTIRFEKVPDYNTGLTRCPLCGEMMSILKYHIQQDCAAIPGRSEKN